jgi:surfactin synthase thioesterase subunit
MTATASIHTSRPISTWFVIPKPNPQPRLRLFCFPYAGAGAGVYRTWPEGLLPQAEIVALQYPGRENRLREALYVSIQPLVRALADELLPLLNLPFAFYGHSLGGLIAFELARTLRQRQAPQPAHLFVSSRRAPHLPDPHPPLHTLEDAAFTQAVQQRYNGIPAVIRQDPELMALFLPTMKADFAILESYKYSPEPAFDFPITVYAGLQDPGLTPAELSAWRTYTTKSFSAKFFPGDHFFLQSQRLALLQAISNDLSVY